MAGGENPNENGGDAAAVEGAPTHYIASLPMPVKKRIKALKKLQLEHTKISEQFFLELSELEKKFGARYAPLLVKRAEVVTGKHEPTDEECAYTDPNAQLVADLEKVNIDENKDVSGIPSFWLTCLKNAEMLQDIVQEHDEPILEHLTDITVDETTDKFVLNFHFSPNEYFSNSVLTKEYKVRTHIAEDDPFNYDGPEICSKKGCKIEWKAADKNVTEKKVTRKQKNKKTGVVRTIAKTVQNDSFFNFFEESEEKALSEMEGEEAAFCTTDFETGQFIKERVVPKAILFFTGEMVGDYEYEDEMEDEADLSELDDEAADSDADPDYKPSKKALKKVQAGQQPECKQQ